MDRVIENLTYQQLWSDVTKLNVDKFEFAKGRPPKKLHPDDDEIIGEEFILASYLAQDWTVRQWAEAFASLKSFTGSSEEPKRIIMAMVTDDSTVVYYIVYNGLQVPRKH